MGALVLSSLGSYWLYALIPGRLAAFRLDDVIILGLLLGFGAVVGDLAESIIKRSAHTKDSSRILPGIGGTLDLIDSLLFTAPLMSFLSPSDHWGVMRKRRVVILGATGSIGQSARKVARDIPDRMEIVGMSAHLNAEELARGGEREFPGAEAAPFPRARAESNKLIELATLPEADMVLIAIVGTAGLQPALAAIEAGKDIAVASKEILVMAGESVMKPRRDARACRCCPWTASTTPSSSASKVAHRCRPAAALILTAGGGPFRTWPARTSSAA